MRTRVKRLPRLWCALQGLLPLEEGRAAPRREVAWAAEETPVPMTTERAEPGRQRGTKSSAGRAAL